MKKLIIVAIMASILSACAPYTGKPAPQIWCSQLSPQDRIINDNPSKGLVRNCIPSDTSHGG